MLEAVIICIDRSSERSSLAPAYTRDLVSVLLGPTLGIIFSLTPLFSFYVLDSIDVEAVMTDAGVETAPDLKVSILAEFCGFLKDVPSPSATSTPFWPSVCQPRSIQIASREGLVSSRRFALAAVAFFVSSLSCSLH